MKAFYFGLGIILWFSHNAQCLELDNWERENSLSSDVPVKRNLLKNVTGIIGKIPFIGWIPGAKEINHDLWNLVSSFDICEVHCVGKNCFCCQKRNLVFFHLNLCMNTRLKPTEKAIDVFMMAGNKRLFSINLSFHKMGNYCKRFGKGALLENEVCVKTILQDYKTDGFSICIRADVKMKDITIFEVNFDCFNFAGEVVLSGRPKGQEANIALLRIMNPLKFVELLKKLVSE